MDFILNTPTDIAKGIAERMVRVRKRKKITQKVLASRSNVSYATLRKFEKTGRISFESFIKLAMELGMANELEALFTTPVYTSIEEVIRDGR